jgi:hypothetical protein
MQNSEPMRVGAIPFPLPSKPYITGNELVTLLTTPRGGGLEYLHRSHCES